jgi:hypothetical protein
MSGADVPARQLLDLYATEIRGFLSEHEVPNLDSLDQNAELLTRALSHVGDLSIGFVGESQVGKSTLINALLDRQALPSGGIGPLTAQATRVIYAPENGLTVKYHGKKQLNQHSFAIARYLERRGELHADPSSGEGVPVASDELPDDDDNVATSLVDALDEQPGDDTELDTQKTDLGRYMLAQAKRILHFGNAAAPADPSDVLLLDGMRAILGQKPRGDAEDLAPYAERIAAVQAVLSTSEELTEATEKGASQFNKALRLRAAGWLSPLVAELDLRLKADVLRGLSLVDLPGIGVLNDPAGKEAESFVRLEGDALVVVFRNSGVTQGIADLLERTGVITKLLFGGSADVAPIQVVLAVTHLDDVARGQYAELAREARDNGDPLPDRHETFRRLSDEMVETMRQMVAAALRNSRSFDDLPEDQRATREAVVQRLCTEMQIFCVASPDYLSMSDGDADGMAFLRDPESTFVPDLRRHLMSLARDANTRRQRTIDQFERALRAGIRDHLAAIAQMYEEGRGAAIQEFERFRDAVTTAAEPLRLEMSTYHGEALGVLRKAMHAELQLVCRDAEMAGMKKLQRLSRDGRGLHFMSLKAALNRDGVWDKRGVNYPESITLAMVDAIASQWETKIVERVREEVRALADRDLKLVERLCDVARTANERILADTPMEAQKRILQANSRTAVAWTKEHLEQFRTNVSESLRTAVEKPIERACKKAVRARDHEGAGAKNRILDAFDEGGEGAVAEATKQAEASLKEHYNKLLRKLNEGFLKENHDPIQAAVETLTGEQVTRARRADAQRKRHVTARVNKFHEQLAESDASAATLQMSDQWHSASV